MGYKPFYLFPATLFTVCCVIWVSEGELGWSVTVGWMNSPLPLTAGAPAESLRAWHHWLRSHACHREDGEPVNSSERTSKLVPVAPLSRPLCSLWSLPAAVNRPPRTDWLFPAWSCARCWNMNQSAGAAQHSRRYSSEGKVRTALVVAVHCSVDCVWFPVPLHTRCMMCDWGLTFTSLVYVLQKCENKVVSCSNKLRGSKLKHVEKLWVI